MGLASLGVGDEFTERLKFSRGSAPRSRSLEFLVVGMKPNTVIIADTRPSAVS